MKGWIRPTEVTAFAQRQLKVSLVCLLLGIALLLGGHRAFQSFSTSGQAISLSAPANVTATDNAYSMKVAVEWNAVRGATLYRIFRHTTNNSGTATALGTTPQSIFFDATGAANQAFFYWVRAENGSNTSSLSQSDQGSRTGANIVGPIQPLNPPLAPAGNAVTAAKAYLGKALFWDEQLSSTRTVACGTCHFATSGGSDARSIVSSTRARNPGADAIFNTADDVFASPGVISNNGDGTYNWSAAFGFGEQVTGRKSRSYVDAGYSNTLFWDGRATATFTDPIGGGVLLQNGAALESQVLGPPVSAAEMAHVNRNWNEVAVRIAQSKPLALSPSVPTALNDWIDGRTYAQLFEEAFGTAEVTPARIAMAIATFERTVYSDRTRFDQAVQQTAPLSAAETRGQGVFNQSRCNVCHAGSLFSDNAFHNIGVRPQLEDTGRFQVTGNANNIGEFRTPSLRNVALRAPFMHNGRLASLEDVVDFYNRGGDFDAPNINRNLIRPLGISAQQRSDLVAFLRTLTDSRVAIGSGAFDRPMLYSESARVPRVSGNGTAGSGGTIPRVTAVQPAIIGNPSFVIGVSNALGGAQAVLVIDSRDPGTGAPPAVGSSNRSVVSLSGSGAGQGFGSISLQIPNDTTLLGATFYGRWYVADGNASGGTAVSPLFQFTVFGGAVVSPNPLDDTRTYVRQHYRDFLGREPDAPGWDFWTDNIEKCRDDSRRPASQTIDQCLDKQRETTSGAFFLSTEFQYTGYYLYRVYKGGLGRPPTFDEFGNDLQALTQGIVVNNSLAPGIIEQNKRNFALAFTQRTDFASIYGALDNTAYVNRLFETTGINASAQDRAALVSGLTNNAETRASVLQKIVDGIVAGSDGQPQFQTPYGEDFYIKEFNAAFVLMEYFGYLRRDPDESGYNFWKTKLDQFSPTIQGAYGSYVSGRWANTSTQRWFARLSSRGSIEPVSVFNDEPARVRTQFSEK
ncbi:MAG: cytochrome c peroxidase [Pyrinomonadaceae bacterium]